ncbi:MAG: PAS domain-containing protein [Lachnospiraceae bacterium]|nr:PAS domain-containing protein [Lachnospiraceae bacterium]
MIVENTYLRKALEKSGYVVMVLSGNGKDRYRSLDYISPNASMLGMNAELLNKGLKLPYDYIHPEDREKMLQVFHEAFDSGLNDYVHKYRLVGDDGKIYRIANEVNIVREEDGVVKAEFYMKERKSKEEKEKQKAEDREKKRIVEAKNEKINLDDSEYAFIGEKNKAKELMDAFAGLTGLYSTVLDKEGRNKFQPVGPDTNMGDFYDLFQTPGYRDFFNKVRVSLEGDAFPEIKERLEGGDGRLSMAPIYYNDSLQAIWVLGSYTASESRRLERVYKAQWEFAELVSDFLVKSFALEVEAARAKGAGKKLREELARQNIINEALSKINLNMAGDTDMVIDETIRDVGINLNLSKILLLTANHRKGKGFEMRAFYDSAGEMPSVILQHFSDAKMKVVTDIVEANGGRAVLDSNNITEEIKMILMKYNSLSVIIDPIILNEQIYGYIFYSEEKANRNWTKEEARFTRNISLIIQNMLDNADGSANAKTVSLELIESFNYLKIGVFVKDSESAEVLFSNKALNNMLGYDFTGKDSRELIQDLHDRFDDIGAMRKGFVDKDKHVTWRSYISAVDCIMEIEEIRIEWLQGEPASLFFLRKANE